MARGWASGLAEKLHSKLTLLHVVPDSESVVGPRSNRDSRTSAVNSARDELHKMRDSAGATCDVHIEIGEPAKTVVAFAGTLKAHLLVIGRSPQNGLIGRLRANAYTIISQASCPVVRV
jgi:nucleotide-binding universal stress UspA family protein